MVLALILTLGKKNKVSIPYVKAALWLLHSEVELSKMHTVATDHHRMKRHTVLGLAPCRVLANHRKQFGVQCLARGHVDRSDQ